jgi:hypothetical protein
MRDAMDASGASDEGESLRTVKTCGPDAPTLAFKSRGKAREARVAKKPGHPGDHVAAVNTIARGMPDVSGIMAQTPQALRYE